MFINSSSCYTREVFPQFTRYILELPGHQATYLISEWDKKERDRQTFTQRTTIENDDRPLHEESWHINQEKEFGYLFGQNMAQGRAHQTKGPK